MAWTIKNFICSYSGMFRGWAASKNMQSRLWLHFPERLSSCLPWGHQPCSQNSFLHDLKKAIDRKWSRERKGGIYCLSLKWERMFLGISVILASNRISSHDHSWANRVQGGNYPGVKSWPIPGVEGGSTVQDMASAKEGGGTGRHVGSHEALYGVQNLMLPTESIVQICFFGVIALHKNRVLDESNLVKNLPANAGDARDTGSVPGSRRSLGGGHGNPLQYSCLENPMDRVAWWAKIHGAAKSRTRLKQLSM